MLKRALLGGLIGTFLISSVAFAAPQVQIGTDKFIADFHYTFSKSEEKYHEDWGNTSRRVNGHSQEYELSYGLKNGYAVSLGLCNNRFNAFDDGLNQQTTPSIDSIDLRIQKQLSRHFALFTGVRHVTGSWTYSSSAYTPSSITRDNDSQNIAEIGFIAETHLSGNVSAYCTAEAGHDLREYRVGFTDKTFDIGYQYVDYKNLYNPLFASAAPPINGLDLTVKGFYFGLVHKF